MVSRFAARDVFPALESLPRSYFLGHHKAALEGIKTRLQTIDLIVECRDARVPVTSVNPLFENALEGRRRIVVYTKRDLAGHDAKSMDLLRRIQTTGATRAVHFANSLSQGSLNPIMTFFREQSSSALSLAGFQVLTVGMPNVGKSTLLNSLRSLGTGLRKSAHTGAQPGVTRKIATSTKIWDGEAHQEPSVYLKDTPGVFIPYVPDPEAMLKLALCGCVKDGIIAPTTLADYLLFQINLRGNPAAYGKYHSPTNDITQLLEAIARKTGRLGKGGIPELEGTALWLIQRWRIGELGTFMLDDVTEEGLRMAGSHDASDNGPLSLHQAKKLNAAMKKVAQQKKFEASRAK